MAEKRGLTNTNLLAKIGNSDILRATETSGLMNPVGSLSWRGLRSPFPFGIGTPHQDTQPSGGCLA